MFLSNNDLKKIGNLIQAGYEYLDVKWDKRLIQLELKFDTHRIENNKHFKVIESKLDQFIKTLFKTRLKKS